MEREEGTTKRLYFEAAGHGPPILFLHGLGMGRKVWEPIVQRLKSQYRCIWFDMYGFGDHKPPQELRHISFDEWITEVQDIMQALELSKIHLVGHSLGSLVALAFAAQYPSLCLSVTAISTFPEFGPTLTNAFEQRAQKVEKVGIDGIIHDLLQGGFSPHTLKNSPHILEHYRHIVSQNTSFQYALACRSVANVTIEPLLHQIRTPVQLIVGLDDKVTPPALSESVCQMVPDCIMAALDECGHQIHMEKPEEVAKIIHDFLHKKLWEE